MNKIGYFSKKIYNFCAYKKENYDFIFYFKFLTHEVRRKKEKNKKLKRK